MDYPVNLNSPQQLSDLLFQTLGLPRTRRTKTGYSTDANALQDLKSRLTDADINASVEGIQVVDQILEYRQICQAQVHLCGCFTEMVNPATGRIHTSYNQTGSATGRVSSSDPNLQNIPFRTELGRQVRRAFVAPRRSPAAALFRRLLPDRAAGFGPFVPGPGLAGGLQKGRGHPLGHGFVRCLKCP